MRRSAFSICRTRGSRRVAGRSHDCLQKPGGLLMGVDGRLRYRAYLIQNESIADDTMAGWRRNLSAGRPLRMDWSDVQYVE